MISLAVHGNINIDIHIYFAFTVITKIILVATSAKVLNWCMRKKPPFSMVSHFIYNYFNDSVVCVMTIKQGLLCCDQQL